MRHLPAALILTVALALAAACGDSGEEPATTPPTSVPETTTSQASTTTTPPPTTTTVAPTTTTPTTTTTSTTTTMPDQFAEARATLATVLEACNDYQVGDLGDAPHFDGSAGDPTVGGEFTREVEPGIFEFRDRDGVELLVHVDGAIITGADGPAGVAPRPYSFWCPPDVLPGTLDEGHSGDPLVVLEPDGLREFGFGAEPEKAIARLTDILGPPDEDSGWIGSFSSFGTCPGDEVRVVRWDELEVYFTDLTDAYGPYYDDPDQPHFITWRAATSLDDEPPAHGFETAEGVAPGSPLSFVREVYGEENVEVFYEEAFDVYFLHIGEEFTGSVSGETGNDLVTSLQAGFGCGE